MLCIVFNQRVIRTLGQRSQRRKCWDSLEAVTVLTTKDRPHGYGPSGLPHILSADPKQHYSIMPRFSVALLSIISVAPQPRVQYVSDYLLYFPQDTMFAT